jgi:hypothetical protein
MMVFLWRSAAVGLLAGLFSLSAQADPMQKIYDDWQLSCNNLNYCTARNILDNQGLILVVSREAGAEGRSSVTIDYSHTGDEVSGDPVSAGVASHLSFNGKPLVFNRRGWDIAKKHLSTDNRPVVEDFIADIREGNSIQLMTHNDASVHPAISLKGFKSALQAMDQQQSRTATRTAWGSRGNKPASQVPGVPEVPVLAHFSPPTPLSEAEISAITQNVAASLDHNDCSLDPAEREVHLYALSDEKALMTVHCDMGAYNLFSLGVIVSRKAPYKSEDLVLKMPFRLTDDEAMPELINSAFDDKSGILTIHDKGRAKGDCGVMSRWLFDGNNFRLAYYASQPSCDGYSRASDWPVLWVTRPF